VPEPISSRSWARWLPAFLKSKPAQTPAPVAVPDPPAPVGHGVQPGPAPRGARQGTLVAVSLYLPFGADLGAVVAAIVTLGYSNVEIREAQHEATKSRISSSARIPVVEATVDQVRAALRAALPPAYKDARADIDLWPTY